MENNEITITSLAVHNREATINLSNQKVYKFDLEYHQDVLRKLTDMMLDSKYLRNMVTEEITKNSPIDHSKTNYISL